MKRTFLSALSLSLVSLSVVASDLNAYQSADTALTESNVVEVGDWRFKCEVAKNGITLTDAVAEGDGRLVIPSTCNLNGEVKEVVAISKHFLHGNTTLTSLTLPATLTDLGSTETEPMFDVMYQGTGTAWSPLSTPLRTTVRGHSTWRMTVGVRIASDTLNFNKWGSAILATKENTLGDYYNDGSMQLYLQKGHSNIIFKLDNADDRYRYCWRNADGTTLVNDTFTFVLENDGSGGYEAKVIFANGEEQAYSITAGERAKLNDFNTLWSSMPKGMDVTVKFEKLVNGELFVDCSNLAEILVEEGSESFSSIDGVLYNKDASHILRFPECGAGSWDIDRKVTRVYAGALHNVDADITFHSNPKIAVVRGYDVDTTSAIKARFHLSLEDAACADFESANPNTYQTVRYERNLPEGVYGTIMLPFVPDDVQRRSMATTQLDLQYNAQTRPEFDRNVFSASWSYLWNSSKQIRHRYDLVGVNLVSVPRKDQYFIDNYLNQYNSKNSIMKFNYEDLFIFRTGYNFYYTSPNAGVTKNYFDVSHSVRASVETSGNLLYLLSKAMKTEKDSIGQYRLLNLAYAQYLKTDLAWTMNMNLGRRNNLLFHVEAGVAYPYGNSRMLPFEKRYYAGGANGVRGWAVRGLGPGRYVSRNETIDYINQSGDIKLDLSLEYRMHMFWKLDGAVFVDAGNIWTMHDYSDQPGGVFLWNEFYKQIAASYGLGIRLDLNFLVLRLDVAMKAVNPVYAEGPLRYPIAHPRFKRDFAWHFAVGYPF